MGHSVASRAETVQGRNGSIRNDQAQSGTQSDTDK